MSDLPAVADAAHSVAEAEGLAVLVPGDVGGGLSLTLTVNPHRPPNNRYQLRLRTT